MCYKDRECAIFSRAICSSHSRGVISIVVLLHCKSNKTLKHLFIFQKAVKNKFFFPLRICLHFKKGFFPFLRGRGLRSGTGVV